MKVSIITVSYNSDKTIEDTLKSVASQTYADIEHIIIDGDSKDNTLEIVAQFPHISKVLSEKDKGIYDAMNKGIKLSSGEVVGILNSDDTFASEEVISNIVAIFQHDKSIDAVYGNIEYFRGNEFNKITRRWKSKPYKTNFFKNGNVPPHPSLFVRKKVYDALELYFPDFKICSDYEFMFRMLKVHKYKSHYLDKTIVKMREGGISTQGIKSYLITTKEIREAWIMNGFKYPFSLYFIRPFKKITQVLFKS